MGVEVSNADFLNLSSLQHPCKEFPFLSFSDSWMGGQRQARAKTFFPYKILATMLTSETFMKWSVMEFYFSLIFQIKC